MFKRMNAILKMLQFFLLNNSKFITVHLNSLPVVAKCKVSQKKFYIYLAYCVNANGNLDFGNSWNVSWEGTARCAYESFMKIKVLRLQRVEDSVIL